MNGFDHEAFEFYYENGVKAILSNYKTKYSELIISSNAKKCIWDEYVRLNEHCKTVYMKNDSKLLDRHKVAACYIYSIEKAYIIHVSDSLKNGDDSNLMLNERLAVSFGLSILRSMILDIVEDTISDQKTKEDLMERVFKGDFEFPRCTHGDFKSNLLSQLYFTRKEGNYNILSLAETLYMLECFNLLKHGYEEDFLKLPCVSE